LLEEIARSYLEAGAELLSTNTFGGSPLKLEPFGLAERCEQINRQAVEATRRVAGERAYVMASIGPCGQLLRPYGDLDPETLYSGFERQARALVDGGADLLVVETMTDLTEAVLAVRAATAAAGDRPVAASMTFDATPRGYFTVMGVTVQQAAAALVEAGARIVGANCGRGIEDMAGVIREYRQHTRRPLLVQANAGLPEHREGRVIYPQTPEFTAERAKELLDLGVSILGGCCGTTPDHTRALRRLLDDRAAAAG
jgi:5-methyltetrahydrofolate--homocysteine methyltransferase